MITGRVSAHREPVVPLRLRGPSGQELAIEAVVDTGFNGHLTLPPSLIAALGFPFRRHARAVLGDGSPIMFDIHEAVVLWEGSPRRVPVDAANTDPLLGMGLLHGHELLVQAVEGGDVSIKALRLA